MKDTNLKVIGAFAAGIGTVVSIYGFVQLDKGKGRYNIAVEFGNFDTAGIWAGHILSYKICIAAGLVMLLVGVIALIVWCTKKPISGENENINITKNNSGNSVTEKMMELKRMKDINLITEEEFEKKKKEFLDLM